ncbi:MAG: ankyrin repeat domain-containing protein [Chlamydiales bacterium]
MTTNEQKYDNTPYHEINVLGEILNGIKYSTLALIGGNLFSSMTSAIQQRLWSHLPAIAAYGGLAAGGHLGVSYLVDQLLALRGLSEQQKTLLTPWLNLVGRLAIGCVPKVHATKDGVHYRYPSLSGPSSQTFSSEQISTIQGDVLTIRRQGTLDTPEGSFDGTYEAEFKLHSIQELTGEKISIKVTTQEGVNVPIEFSTSQGLYGPEIHVNCENLLLKQHWDNYFRIQSHDKTITSVASEMLKESPTAVHPFGMPSCPTGLIIGALASFGTHNPLPISVGALSCINSASASPSEEKQTVLHVAAEGNMIHNLNLPSIIHKYDINALDAPQGKAPLHIAIINGHLRAVQLLVENGASLDIRFNELTPAALAVKYNQLECLDYLASQSSTLFQDRTPGTGNLLHVAARRDDATTLNYLLTKYPGETQPLIEDRNENGQTPLYAAVQANNIPAINTLSKLGADFNPVDLHGQTPLHTAALSKSIAVINTLVRFGANIEPYDNEQKRPIDLVQGKDLQSMEIRNLLITIETLMKDGKFLVKKRHFDQLVPLPKTLLHIEAEEKWVGNYCLRNLHKFDINAIGPHGETPLHIAVMKGNDQVVKVFLEHGASPIIPLDGLTAVALAVKLGETSTLDELLNHSIALLHDRTPGTGNLLHVIARWGDATTLNHLLTNFPGETQPLIEDRNESGQTPLHIAAQVGDLEAISVLATAQANLNAVDFQDFTPLNVAHLFQQTEAVKLLVYLGAHVDTANPYFTPLNDYEEGLRSGEIIAKESHNASLEDLNHFYLWSRTFGTLPTSPSPDLTINDKKLVRSLQFSIHFTHDPVIVLETDDLKAQQLLLQFANTYLSEFKLVYRIDGATEKSREEGFRKLARSLKLPFEGELGQVLLSIKNKLETQNHFTHWLLILNGIVDSLTQPESNLVLNNKRGNVIGSSKEKSIWNYPGKQRCQFKKISHRQEWLSDT